MVPVSFVRSAVVVQWRWTVSFASSAAVVASGHWLAHPVRSIARGTVAPVPVPVPAPASGRPAAAVDSGQWTVGSGDSRPANSKRYVTFTMKLIMYTRYLDLVNIIHVKYERQGIAWVRERDIDSRGGLHCLNYGEIHVECIYHLSLSPSPLQKNNCFTWALTCTPRRLPPRSTEHV